MVFTNQDKMKNMCGFSLKLYDEKEKKMYVNNVAPPKNMLLTQWFFRKEKARMPGNSCI